MGTVFIPLLVAAYTLLAMKTIIIVWRNFEKTAESQNRLSAVFSAGTRIRSIKVLQTPTPDLTIG